MVIYKSIFEKKLSKFITKFVTKQAPRQLQNIAVTPSSFFTILIPSDLKKEISIKA